MTQDNRLKVMHPDPTSLSLTIVNLDQAPSVVERCSDVLSIDEKKRAERFRFPKDRSHYIVGRYVLRCILAERLDDNPEHLIFSYGKNGKPYIAGVDLEFNISHSNTRAAIEAGATRVHGTALGIGERVGNTPMEQILVNMHLLGWRDDDLSCLQQYVETVSEAVKVPIPVNQPIVGPDAFRTATGVHAAAVIKAQCKGDSWLADRVYSGVPASIIGRCQEIEVGHLSGASNVHFFLSERGLNDSDSVCEAILNAAKMSERLLTEDEVLDIFRSYVAEVHG